MPRRPFRTSLALLAVCFGLLASCWSVLTPPFKAPDEPQHFNSVLRLVNGGGWPAPGAAYLTEGTVLATQEAGFDAGLDVLAARDPADVPSRSVVTGMTAPFPAPITQSYDQMSQHPPAYYLLGAGLLKALGAQHWTWDSQLLTLRLLSVALTVGAVPLIGLSAEMLTGSRPIALAAAVVPMAIPQVAHIAGGASNDALATFAGSVVVYLVVRAMTRPPTPLTLLGVGGALGLGLLTKGFMLAAIPMVALALLVPAHGLTGRRRTANALIALTAAFAVGGWWWLRNLLLYGEVQPAGDPPLPQGDGQQTVRVFLYQASVRLSQTFWGSFGWLELQVPLWLVRSGNLLVALALLGAAVWAVRRRRAGTMLALAAFPAGVFGIVLVGGGVRHFHSGQFPGLQGRYLFCALVVLGIAVAAALDLVVRSASLRAALPAAVTVAAAAISLHGLVLAADHMYRPAGGSLDEAWARWGTWGLAPAPVNGTVLGLAAAAWTTTVLVLLVQGWRTRAEAAPAPGDAADPGRPTTTLLR
ncbi:DUF2142 domain-containing protein [Actinotalea sp. BY-33]|uniref:DUF2142 domain-containing protein n=1 Tax=Actinotalea soli TaxID=2819234 RepID=A0A939LMP9_9CELL|nr:DUF2142 domain-containing protein [Actinotalea soli]MBO1750942.1 DUF2142 domain-containing protein [Actinotalea soli]